MIVELTEAEKGSLAKATDRYAKTVEKLGGDLSDQVSRATQSYVRDRTAAQAEYQGEVLQIAENRGVDLKTVQRYEIDRTKTRIAFVVVEGVPVKS